MNPSGGRAPEGNAPATQFCNGGIGVADGRTSFGRASEPARRSERGEKR